VFFYGTLHILVAAVNKPANETMTGESSQATSNTSAPPTATTCTIAPHSSTILPESSKVLTSFYGFASSKLAQQRTAGKRRTN